MGPRRQIFRLLTIGVDFRSLPKIIWMRQEIKNTVTFMKIRKLGKILHFEYVNKSRPVINKKQLSNRSSTN